MDLQRGARHSLQQPNASVFEYDGDMRKSGSGPTLQQQVQAFDRLYNAEEEFKRDEDRPREDRADQ